MIIVRSVIAWLIIGAAIVLLFLLAACGGGGSSNPTLPPPPPSSGWVFQYSPGMSQPIPDGQGGAFFDFPSQDGVHYLVISRTAPMSGSITMDYEVTLNGTLVGPPDPTNNCPPIPHFSMYFQRAGDDITNAAFRAYRWFSAFNNIVAGRNIVTVPLVSTSWTDVFGGSTSEGFAAAAGNPQVVGLVFGAGCFAGHGLFVTGGSARFHIHSFSVQ